jgi:ferrous-iron efflux pump FieF
VPTQSAELGIGVSIAAILATIVLLAYQRKIIRQTGSVAIMADNVHYQSDVLLNGSVIVALILDQYFGWHSADPVFGIVIALWLVWGAFQASRHAIDQLMDREWPEAKRRAFLDVAATIPALSGMHDLRTRTSGAHDFAQFHMAFPAETSVGTAHDVMDDVEAKLAAAFPGLQLIIHPDPIGHVDPEGALPAAIAERSEL